MVREEEGEVKSAYQPSPPMLSHVFNSALLSLDPGEVPSLMTKPRAHPTVFCAWPQGRPGIFSEIYSSRSLALTLFFEPLTLHPSLSPASFVFCSPGKCKDWANRTKRSKSFSAHPSQALKKATFFFFTDPFYSFTHSTNCKAWGLISVSPLSETGKIWESRA